MEKDIWKQHYPGQTSEMGINGKIFITDVDKIKKGGEKEKMEKKEKQMSSLQQKLFELQDEKYRDFQCRLMPTVPAEKVIGVRTPVLRRFAKEFSGMPEAEDFLLQLPHVYYEENNLHSFLVAGMKEYDRVIEETERFLPYIDNWATCDSFSPRIFKKRKKDLYEKIRIWIKDEKTYTVRFAVGMLMEHYLEEDFQPEMLELVAGVRSEEYYIEMMCAWYMATALAKQKEAVLPYFRECRMQKEVFLMAVQKAAESFRVEADVKEQLKKFREEYRKMWCEN